MRKKFKLKTTEITPSGMMVNVDEMPETEEEWEDVKEQFKALHDKRINEGFRGWLDDLDDEEQ